MQIQIKVFMNLSALQDSKSVFERIVDVNENLHVPYESIVFDMKFLFGSSAVVSFNVL